MITSKEERQINRPLLYLAGGLVLGETMALWMTGNAMWIGLAILLFGVCFVCVSGTCGGADAGRSRPDGGRLALLLLMFGLIGGVCRMEWEQAVIAREEARMTAASAAADGRVTVCGAVAEIGETANGWRLALERCSVQADGSEEKVRRLYVYLDAETVWGGVDSNLLGESDQGTVVRVPRMADRAAHWTGDTVRDLRLGMRVRALGDFEFPEPDRNPGEFDFQSYCYSKGICGSVFAENLSVLDARHRVIPEALRRLGLSLAERLDRIAEKPDAGILKAMLLGDRSDMDDEVYERYRQNGISHILSISGLHISVVGMGLWKLLRMAGVGYTAAGAVGFSFLLGYGTIVGFGPSVTRAVFMAGISFLAGIKGRTYDLPSAMCVPAVGILLMYPYQLTQTGFQLSFLAVGAIFFPGGVLAKAWELRGFRQGLLVSLSLQMVTMPVVLYHSFEVPLYGLLLNLIVVPLASYLLISGMLGVAGALVAEPLGILMLGGAHYILAWFDVLCRIVGEFHGARQFLGRTDWWAMGAYYGCLLAGAMAAVRSEWRMRTRVGVWSGLWIIGVLFLLPVPTDGLTVTFLDVGQGDGIFLECEGHTMLVDCGSSQDRKLGEDTLEPFLLSKGIREIDTVVISHADQDHVSAIRYLLENAACPVRVGRLLMAEAGREDEMTLELEALAEERGVEVVYIGADGACLDGESADAVWIRGEQAGASRSRSERQSAESGGGLTGLLDDRVEIRCLYPPTDVYAADRNECSLVLEVACGDFRLLLTGDVGVSGERWMTEHGLLGKVTVLKVAHHGSDSSTSQAFLEAVRPSYVILSYGAGNRYGHPKDEVVERCEDIGAEIFRTAGSGAIQIWTDGRRMELRPWLDR